MSRLRLTSTSSLRLSTGRASEASRSGERARTRSRSSTRHLSSISLRWLLPHSTVRRSSHRARPALGRRGGLRSARRREQRGSCAVSSPRKRAEAPPANRRTPDLEPVDGAAYGTGSGASIAGRQSRGTAPPRWRSDHAVRTLVLVAGVAGVAATQRPRRAAAPSSDSRTGLDGVMLETRPVRASCRGRFRSQIYRSATGSACAVFMLGRVVCMAANSP